MAVYYTQVAHASPELITLTQAKKQLKREDFGTLDDVIINECLQAAIDEAEKFINSDIRQRKYKVTLSDWKLYHEFKKQLVTAITKVSYINPAGTTAELDPSKYELLPVDDYAAIINYTDPDNLPDLKDDISNAVTIEITTGYSTAAALPSLILSAIKNLLTDNYNYRGDQTKKIGLSSSRIKLEPYKFYPRIDV